MHSNICIMYFQSWDGHVGTPNWRLPSQCQPNVRPKLNPVTILKVEDIWV